MPGTIAGRFETSGGTPATGYVKVYPNVPVIRDATTDRLLSGRALVNLDETGTFTVSVPTDSDGINPQGVTWTVAPMLSHDQVDPIVGIHVTSGATVQVADVVSVDPEAPVYAVQVTVADLDAVTARVAAVEARPLPPDSPGDIGAVAKVDSPINARDYTSLPEAVAAAATAGRALYLPGGTYNITGNLTLTADNLAILGDGEATTLSFTDGGLVLDGSTEHLFRTTLRGLRITRGGQTPGPALHFKGGGVGTGVARWVAHDIQASSTLGEALLIEGSYIGSFHGCYFRESATGIKIVRDSVTNVVSGNLISFHGGETQGNDVGGYIDSNAGVFFYSHGVEGNAISGLEINSNPRNVGFYGGYFEGNGGWDIKVGTEASGGNCITVNNAYFADAGRGKTAAIVLVRGYGVNISECGFYGYEANSPVSVQEATAGAVRGVASNNLSNGSAPIIAMNGATRFGEAVLGQESSTPIKAVRRASAVLDFPSIAAGGSANLTISVPGAAVGDDATVHFNGTPPAGLVPVAWVSGVGEVTVRMSNFTTAAVNPPAATIRVIVWKF